VHVDICSCPSRLSNVASRPDSYCNTRPKSVRNRLCFVVNWQVPGTPECNWITYFQNREPDNGLDLDVKAKTDEELDAEEQEENTEKEKHSTKGDEKEIKNDKIDHHAVFIRSLSRFLKGSDKFRDKRFKFIPRIVEGHWMVQKAVGNTPAILGTKMTQKYHYNKELNYFEVDMDVGSSSVAKQILQLVRGYCKTMTLDCIFLIEGQRSDELPEQLLGGVRLSNIDYTKMYEFHRDETDDTPSLF